MALPALKGICYFIWKCRCEYVNKNKIKRSKQIISEIRREVRDRCQIAFNTARRDSGLSLKLLTAKNVLAKVDNGLLALNI